ncbi:hypothetical protein [Gordonia rubripertincta]|uniref:hypothetical protein n=1 Tax=Gordonia rubripertincta TaxID=36822 RepID=UPI0015FC614E|nr:hypothetical protein [Gordonia rubripertincta]QMU22525.1 hypothetical protein H3V45_08680 [Gordonia rubripertincta]
MSYPIPEGQPTWARVRHGAGVALPRRLDDGSIGTLPTTVPIRLVLDRGDFAADGSVRTVWKVPDGAWSPGDSIEIGPLQPGVVVEYGIDRVFAVPMPAAPAYDPDPVGVA